MPVTVNGYILNAVNEPEDWSDREYTLLSAIVALLPPNGTLYVDAEHVHSKFVSPDETIDPVLSVGNTGIATLYNNGGVANTTFVTDANGYLRIDASGRRIGLNCVPLAAILHVANTVAGVTQIRLTEIDAGGNGDCEIIADTSGDLVLHPGIVGVTDGVVWIQASHYLRFGHANTLGVHAGADCWIQVEDNNGVPVYLQGKV